MVVHYTFAEFLLILWGLVFVAAREEEAKFKGRNFNKTAQKGVRIMQTVAVRRRSSSSSSSGQGGVDDFGREEAPAWERTVQQAGQVYVYAWCVLTLVWTNESPFPCLRL